MGWKNLNRMKPGSSLSDNLLSGVPINGIFQLPFVRDVGISRCAAVTRPLGLWVEAAASLRLHVSSHGDRKKKKSVKSDRNQIGKQRKLCGIWSQAQTADLSKQEVAFRNTKLR